MLPFPQRLVRFRRRHVRGALATLAALTLALSAVVASSGPATASVGSDQAQIAQLEQQIAAQGAHVESLVSHYNEVQARVGALDVQIAEDQSAVTADTHAERAAAAVLQRMAVDAYVSVGAQSPTLMLFANTGSVTTTLEEHAYLGVVNNKWNDALTALHLHQARTQEAQHSLRSEQANAKATLRLLAAAHDAATAAIASDESDAGPRPREPPFGAGGRQCETRSRRARTGARTRGGTVGASPTSVDRTADPDAAVTDFDVVAGLTAIVAAFGRVAGTDTGHLRESPARR